MSLLTPSAFAARSEKAKGTTSLGQGRRQSSEDYPLYRITQVNIFPSTADSPDGVGTPAPFPAGSENDPAVLEAWATQAGDLAPSDVVDMLVGTEFAAVDTAPMKARLAAYRSIAVTEDPGSALAVTDADGSIYLTDDSGNHSTINGVTYVDGEGQQSLTGTLQTGETFYIYMQVLVVPVAS